MTINAPPDETLRPALDTLAEKDADLARVYNEVGLPPVRRSDEGFSGLIRMIAGQQVSTASATAIVGRLSQALPSMSAEEFLLLDDAMLAAIGFSRAKMRYGRALATAITSKELVPDAFAGMPDEDVMTALTSVPGIGRWTAEVYLLFALQRPDVWPAGDLAVVKALMAAKGLSEKPKEPELRLIAEEWRPHRSAAARLLWHYYRHAGVSL